VLDVMMPGEDGISLTRDLRKRSQVPILLLTAKGEAANRIEGFEAGADDYLVKPFEPKELLLADQRDPAPRAAGAHGRAGAQGAAPGRGAL
jgi:DNA-binding response OmpR family regulator